MLTIGTYVKVRIGDEYLFNGCITDIDKRKCTYIIKDYNNQTYTCLFDYVEPLIENPNHATPADTHLDDTLIVNSLDFDYSSRFEFFDIETEDEQNAQFIGDVVEIRHDYVTLFMNFDYEEHVFDWRDASHFNPKNK